MVTLCLSSLLTSLRPLVMQSFILTVSSIDTSELCENERKLVIISVTRFNPSPDSSQISAISSTMGPILLLLVHCFAFSATAARSSSVVALASSCTISCMLVNDGNTSLINIILLFTNAMGLLISWATPAASRPRDAIFSDEIRLFSTWAFSSFSLMVSRAISLA